MLRQVSGLLLLFLLFAHPIFAQPVPNQDLPPAPKEEVGDPVWEALVNLTPPPRSEAWKERRPTPEEFETYAKLLSQFFINAANGARDFYTQYPAHSKAASARYMEFQMLQKAAEVGDTSQLSRLEKLEDERIRDSSFPERDRFDLRLKSINRRKQMDSTAEYEERIRKLFVEFPNREEPYEMLLGLANRSRGLKRLELAMELAESAGAPEHVRNRARGMIQRYDFIGHPLPLRFPSMDGRIIDLKKMTGKVILLNFWSSTSSICLKQVPELKKLYQDLYPQGLEIIGISFDKDQTALETVLRSEKVSWPQYFDGKGWENYYSRLLGIQVLPSRWLIDKHGVVRYTQLGDDLEQKIKELLAED